MKRHAPATLRNTQPIIEVLRKELPSSGRVLEVASGTGEHAAAFARAFPGVTWQPSDRTVDELPSIQAYREEAGLKNLAEPIVLDAATDRWSLGQADAIICINMIHISDWVATVGLFRGCAKHLTQDAPIILYGPYLDDSVETEPSNLAFDRSLKERNPAWGLRKVADVDRLADEYGFTRSNRYEMPANNLILVYRRQLADSS